MAGKVYYVKGYFIEMKAFPITGSFYFFRNTAL